MQSTEITRLYQSFKNIFPTAHIKIIDHNSNVVIGGEGMSCNAAIRDGTPCLPMEERYSNYKEIQTIHGQDDEPLHKLSFPLPPQNQLFVYIPSRDVEDILTAAKMADSVVQLFLTRPAQAAQSARQSDTMLLLDHLFHPSNAEEDTYTALLAAELGFDMSLPRAVCILRIEPDTRNPVSRMQPSHAILQTIRNFTAAGSQDIIGAFGASELILCHVMEDAAQDIRLLENIYTYINKNYPVTCRMGVGLTVTDLSHYGDSFISAQSVFRYAQSRPRTGTCIYFASDYLAEHLVCQIPEAFFEHFLSQELSYMKATPTAPETIRALVENNMDILPAAESLFIHRNTMVFRLNHLKKQLRLNPLHRDSDRFKLILLHHYYIKKYGDTVPVKEA